MAACERLVLLDHDPRELRDYAALLYHCAHYEECLQYLTSYQTATVIDNNMEGSTIKRVIALKCQSVSFPSRFFSQRTAHWRFWRMMQLLP
jgi:hypothetical protein